MRTTNVEATSAWATGTSHGDERSRAAARRTRSRSRSPASRQMPRAGASRDVEPRRAGSGDDVRRESSDDECEGGREGCEEKRIEDCVPRHEQQQESPRPARDRRTARSPWARQETTRRARRSAPRGPSTDHERGRHAERSRRAAVGGRPLGASGTATPARRSTKAATASSARRRRAAGRGRRARGGRRAAAWL